MGTLNPPFCTLIPNTLTICTYTEFAPFSYEHGGRIVGSDLTLIEGFAAQYGLSHGCPVCSRTG